MILLSVFLIAVTGIALAGLAVLAFPAFLELAKLGVLALVVVSVLAAIGIDLLLALSVVLTVFSYEIRLLLRPIRVLPMRRQEVPVTIKDQR